MLISPTILEDAMPEEKQCIYCGRWMKNDKVWRRADHEGYDLWTCIACQAVLKLTRAQGVAGRQRYVAQILKILKAPPGYRSYVDRNGLGFLEEVNQ